jgi:uncharacterized SAM-binding protein YcdF (DUF218 family)
VTESQTGVIFFMYFFASKALAFFSLPTNVLACLALVGLVLIGLRRRIGKILTVAAAAAIGFAGLSPLGNMLLTPLEQRFAGMQFPDGKIDGIIVLGGSYDRIRGYLNTVVLEDGTHAMAAVPDLARRYPEAKLIFSGGTAEENVHVPPEAIVARQLFISFGISQNRIVIEDRSRNTLENARLTAQMLAPKPGQRWLLVTNAFHMPRAMGTFRQAGFDVAAFPVGWRTNGWRDFFWPPPSANEGLRRVDVAVREWIGLVAYKLLGYSNALFPVHDPRSRPK